MKTSYKYILFLFVLISSINNVRSQVGTLTGTGMGVCNLFSFNICPTQTISPLNYGNQGYACTGATQPDVSFTTMGSGWRVNKFNWKFTASTSGFVSGFTSAGVFQSFPFSATNTITPLSYSGLYIQFAVNGVATGSLMSQANFSISLSPVVFGSNSYTYCSSTATSIAISPTIPSSGGPWNYNWQPGSLSGSTVNVSPSVNTIYTVTANSPAGCASTTTISLTTTCVASPQTCPGSLLFDATHPAVDMPSGNQYYSGTNGGYTWECWFKLNQPFGTDMRPLISAVDGVLYEDQWFGFGWQGGWFNEPVTKLVFKVDGPNGVSPTGPNCSYEPVGGYVLGTWYHAAGVMDYTNQTSKLFLNGALVDSKPITTSPITRVIPAQLCLNWGGTPLSLFGNMDEVRIWERPVTDAEILANYNHCLTGNEQNLLVYYRCNQPGGTTVVDATPNNNIGTFSNLPSWSTQQPVLTGTACATSSPTLTTSNSSSVICAGTTVTLSVSGVTSYTWSSGPVNSNLIVTPSVTTTYTVATDLSACSGSTLASIITVSVIPTPTISISSTSSVFCANQTNTLTASGANTYTWSSSPSLSSTTGSVVTTTPITSESYNIIGAIGTCTNSAVYSLTVNPSPTVTVASSSSTICSGQSVTLTANGANTFTWSPSATLSSSLGSIVTASPLSTINYSVIGASNSCTNSAIATISVLPTPTLTLSPNTIICLGVSSSATLTVSGASTYTWINSSTLSSSIGSTVVATPNTTTIYTVTGVTASCSNTSIVTVSVNPSPIISAVSFTNTSCGLNNGSAALTSSPANNTYTWSGGITSTTNTANSLTNGTYSVTAINGACQTTTVVNILSSLPLLITSTAITPSDCNLNNGSIIVNDNYVNSNYSWSPNVSSTSSANNLSAGNYALTITNGACSTSSVFVIVQLNGPSALIATQSDAICESSNGSINIVSVTDGTAPFQYNFNNTGFSSISTYSNLAQGIYTITVKDAHGCLYNQTFSIDKSMVNLTIDLTTNSPTCDDNDGSIIINNISSGTPPYYSSFNNGVYSSNLIFDQLGIGTYSLSIRDSNMCETGYILTMQENGDYTLYIPNTFTPNNNKVNDIWYVKGTCLDGFNCLIYNRWGEKIKELTDIKEGWDGTYKGNSVPDGVYVYVIEVKTKKDVIKKSGYITVFR